MNDHSPARRSFLKTRTIDVTFTVLLGLFTFVFGYYVFISIRNFKAAKAKKAQVAVAVPYHKSVRHKFKHHAKTTTKSWIPKIGAADTSEVVSYQQKSVVQPQAEAPVTQPQIYADKNSISSPTTAAIVLDKAKPVSEIINTEKQPIKEASLPYTTNLRANETGIINMRKFDNYGSEIIKVIPTNSEVSVLEKGNSYYKVVFENTTGYVAKWNVLKK